MAKTMVHSKCVWFLIVVLALTVSPGRAFDCFNDAQKPLFPCIAYLLNLEPRPSLQCCFGVNRVAGLANSSKKNFRSVCECLKSAARSFAGINFDNARRIPALCHVNLNITIDPNIDCNRF